MSFDLQLADRRALVTGGTRGIGAAVVKTFRGAGAQVIATARSAPARPAEGVRYFTADLSTAGGASEAAESVPLSPMASSSSLAAPKGTPVGNGCGGVSRRT